MQQALAGIKVLELGQLIAGPFCGKVLGDFGAEVIKIEPPGLGDPLRKWRLLRNGTSVWWQVQSRNKRSVTLDLRTAEGQDIARRLAAESDVLIENFRPGTMEDWGLSYGALSAANPRLIMVRVSGYGQDGPYRDRPGFAAIAEAVGGLRHLTGEPGRIPVRGGVSLGDSLAALHGVIGVLLALQARHATGRGQVVDVALHESVFNCMESLLPEFSAFGTVRQPAGSALPGIAPSNAYVCADGLVLIAGNGDSIFRRLMTAIGRDDLGSDPQLAGNEGRVARIADIDGAIGEWTRSRSVQAVLDTLIAVNVPCGRVYTAADIAQDPQYRARGMIQRITAGDGEPLDVPGIVPKLSATPGALRTLAPALGADTDAVLNGIGIDAQRLAELRRRNIV
jgi:formyl-CoA transferase